MIKYYTWTTCKTCYERSKLYQQAKQYAEGTGAEFAIELLGTTNDYQRYVHNIKPLRSRRGVPFVWDEKLNQEIILNGAETKGRLGKMVSGEEQEAQKPTVPRPRRKRTAKAQQPDA